VSERRYGCVVSTARTRERTRGRYRPDELRVLFIGESPPAGDTFFYDADSLLYRATREAFVSAVPKLAGRDDFLDAFRQMGCYLEDLSLEPVDKLPDPAKRQARSDAVPGLTRRLKGMSPRLVVLVVKGIRPQVVQALDGAGLADVRMEALPFPGQWHRARYVAELTALVKSWRRARLLRAPRSPA
jgi:hypothetical protein